LLDTLGLGAFLFAFNVMNMNKIDKKGSDDLKELAIIHVNNIEYEIRGEEKEILNLLKYKAKLYIKSLFGYKEEQITKKKQRKDKIKIHKFDYAWLMAYSGELEKKTFDKKQYYNFLNIDIDIFGKWFHLNKEYEEDALKRTLNYGSYKNIIPFNLSDKYYSSFESKSSIELRLDIFYDFFTKDENIHDYGAIFENILLETSAAEFLFFLNYTKSRTRNKKVRVSIGIWERIIRKIGGKECEKIGAMTLKQAIKRANIETRRRVDLNYITLMNEAKNLKKKAEAEILELENQDQRDTDQGNGNDTANEDEGHSASEKEDEENEISTNQNAIDEDESEKELNEQSDADY
jgi:hypothetical protein